MCHDVADLPADLQAHHAPDGYTPSGFRPRPAVTDALRQQIAAVTATPAPAPTIDAPHPGSGWVFVRRLYLGLDGVRASHEVFAMLVEKPGQYAIYRHRRAVAVDVDALHAGSAECWAEDDDEAGDGRDQLAAQDRAVTHRAA